MNEREALIEKIREVTKTEYYLQNKVKMYNSSRQVEEWIDYYQVMSDYKITLAAKQVNLDVF